MKTIDMELALASYLDSLTNLIVPNVSWGMFGHECDLLVVSKSGYAWEVEIKISRADLTRDKKKAHGHRDHRIKFLYFAIPDHLESHIEHIPERAGIITVHDNGHYHFCKTIRKPKQNGSYKFSDAEKLKIARLGSLRIWGLKRKVRDHREKQ